MEIDRLLSEDFISFSKEIAYIYAKKKQKKQELKAYYDQIMAEIKELDDEAAKLAENFENNTPVESLAVEEKGEA